MPSGVAAVPAAWPAVSTRYAGVAPNSSITGVSSTRNSGLHRSTIEPTAGIHVTVPVSRLSTARSGPYASFALDGGHIDQYNFRQAAKANAVDLRNCRRWRALFAADCRQARPAQIRRERPVCGLTLAIGPRGGPQLAKVNGSCA